MPRTGRAGRRDGLLVALVAAGVVGLRLALSLPLHGPRVFPDETGYLLTARWLAGEGVTPDLGPSPVYHPGLSLVLAPVVRLVESPEATYRAALAVNALCWGGALLLVRRLLGDLVAEATPRQRTAAAALAVASPAAVITATLAWAESLLAVTVLLFLLAGGALARRPGPRGAVVFAAAAAATVLVHPRSVGLLVVATGLVVLLVARGRLALPAAAAGLVTLAVLALGVLALTGSVEDRLYGPGQLVGAGGEDGLVDPGRAVEAVRRLVGQLWYLSAATLGLAVVGAGALVGVLRRTRAVTAGLALASLAAVLVVSAGFSTGTRIDALVFGRYVEAVLPLPLAAGALWLLRADVVARRRALAGAAATLAGLAVALRLGQGLLDRPTGLVAFNVLGIEPLLRAAGDELRVGWATLAVLGLLAVLLLLARWRPAVPLAVAALFLAATASTWVAVVRPDDRRLVPLAELPAEVAGLTGGQAVAYDWDALDLRAPWAYQWADPDLDLVRLDGPGAAGTPWVLGRGTWPTGEAAGARVALVDPGFDQALWVRPGPEQDRLEEEGALLPSPFPGPLPEEAVAAELSVPGERPLELEEGGAVDLAVDVAHRGTGSPWPRYAPASRAFAVGRVRLGARLLDAEGDVVVDGLRGDLPRTLRPGDGAEVALRVPGEGLEPGDHVLEVDLLQEGVARFAERGGAPPLRVPVRVTGG